MNIILSRNKKKILAIIGLLLIVVIGSIIYFTPSMYDEIYIDRLTHDIIKSNGSLKLIEKYLKYRNKKSIDGAGYLQYYGDLYFIYTKYPNNVLYFKDKYRSTIKIMFNDGKVCFEDYHPDGWK